MKLRWLANRRKWLVALIGFSIENFPKGTQSSRVSAGNSRLDQWETKATQNENL